MVSPFEHAVDSHVGGDVVMLVPGPSPPHAASSGARRKAIAVAERFLSPSVIAPL
jgi:hypothetical protein